MGNQLYKLNILHDSKLTTMTIPPDHTILQLKEAIQSNTGVKPNQQVLFCGSQMLRVKRTDTLEKTEIVSGSTITVIKVGKSKPSLNKVVRKSSNLVNKTCIELGNLEIQVLGFQKMGLQLKHKFLVLEEKGPIFPGERKLEYENVKTEICTMKELVVKLLGDLAKIKISEDNVDYRTRRKKIATKIDAVLEQINTVLEQIEQIVQNTDKSLSSEECE